jgi:hypothetical protein
MHHVSKRCRVGSLGIIAEQISCNFRARIYATSSRLCDDDDDDDDD